MTANNSIPPIISGAYSPKGDYKTIDGLKTCMLYPRPSTGRVLSIQLFSWRTYDSLTETTDVTGPDSASEAIFVIYGELSPTVSANTVRISIHTKRTSLSTQISSAFSHKLCREPTSSPHLTQTASIECLFLTFLKVARLRYPGTHQTRMKSSRSLANFLKQRQIKLPRSLESPESSRMRTR